MYSFTKLYKKTSTGAINEWNIYVKGNEIHTVYGQVGGKLQSTKDIIKEGKNIGRSNETTPEEQAFNEAKSKWEKQVKKGYVEELDRAEAGDNDIEGGYAPMLAHKYSDHADKIKFPALTQPKFDGHRCVAVIKGGKATLWSRTGKPINSMPHIVEELQLVYPKGTHRIDGELYNHKYKTNFEYISSRIRLEEPPEDGTHTEVQYHIYDKAMDGGFATRIEHVTNELKTYEKEKEKLKYLKVVETKEAADEDELMDYFESFLQNGYEGSMVRNKEGLYVGKRSKDLLKIKKFDDAEFNIVGIAEGRGKLMGHAAKFLCHTIEGKEFGAKLRGETSKLKELFDDHSLWKGKRVTVKFQGFTNYGIPRFPVAWRIREEE